MACGGTHVMLQPYDGEALAAQRRLHPVRLLPPSSVASAEYVRRGWLSSTTHTQTPCTDMRRCEVSTNDAVCLSRPPCALQLYAQQGVPFVMGTTGGDREKLARSPALRCQLSAHIQDVDRCLRRTQLERTRSSLLRWACSWSRSRSGGPAHASLSGPYRSHLSGSLRDDGLPFSWVVQGVHAGGGGGAPEHQGRSPSGRSRSPPFSPPSPRWTLLAPPRRLSPRFKAWAFSLRPMPS